MTVSLEIVSPEKLLLSRPVDMVVIPGSEGDIGVLEGHTPMIVTLRGGTIDLYEGDKIVEQLFVHGGFAEVTPEQVNEAARAVLRDERSVTGLLLPARPGEEVLSFEEYRHRSAGGRFLLF